MRAMSPPLKTSVSCLMHYQISPNKEVCLAPPSRVSSDQKKTLGQVMSQHLEFAVKFKDSSNWD